MVIKRFVLPCLLSLFIAGSTPAVDLGQFWNLTYPGQTGATGSPMPILTADVLAKARPDECYDGLGQANLYPFDFETEICSPGKAKVNESYVFGLTRSGTDLWFGSAPNMGCLVYGTIAEQGAPTGLTPFETSTWTCEYGDGLYGMALGLPPASGDWRPPSIYVYDTLSESLELKDTGDPLLENTLGLRSAGTAGNVVLLAGPQITSVGGTAETPGINIFAFHAGTGAYLGSRQLIEFNDIRKWVAVDGQLYTGVAVNLEEFTGVPEAAFGAVLRWVGDEFDPFAFEIVGWMDGEAAEIVEHDGRLFVSTWPDFSKLLEEDYDYAGLWMSPPLGTDGLGTTNATGWQKVWSADDYERDEIAARMYNGGALASYQGYLYWGTLHAPLSAGFAHALVHGLIDPANPDSIDVVGLINALLGSHRPISIFRGKDFGSASPETEVLYGLNLMPAYVDDPWPWSSGKIWMILPNKMGPSLYGDAGFGNCWNTYTWTMAVQDDRLYVGTMDWSHTFTTVMLPVFLQGLIDPFPELTLPGTTHGGDLFVFPSASQPAIAVDRAGIGNYGTYGVRTMMPTEDSLYLGTANAMNLMTDPNDALPEGGWELIRLTEAQCASSGVPGDLNGDGWKWFNDFPLFFDCLTPSCSQSQCPLPLYDDECCMLADFDSDGDVDWSDFWAFIFA